MLRHVSWPGQRGEGDEWSVAITLVTRSYFTPASARSVASDGMALSQLGVREDATIINKKTEMGTLT